MTSLKQGDQFTKNDRLYLVRFAIDTTTYDGSQWRTLHCYQRLEGGIVFCEQDFFFRL